MTDDEGSSPVEPKAAPRTSVVEEGTFADADEVSTSPAEKRKRRARPFPAITFEEALALGIAIQQHAAGQKVRRLTLFENMGREAESASSRALVTGSNQYGITTGSYKAEFIELTSEGFVATSPDSTSVEEFRARFSLAVANNDWFRILYEKFKNNRLPTPSVLQDHLVENNLDKNFATECVETFVVNAKFLGLLQTLAGAERLLTEEHIVDELSRESPALGPSPDPTGRSTRPILASPVQAVPASTSPPDGVANTCFYISPIGLDDSEERLHADLFMGALVEPALQEFGLKLVRADQIGQPGLISKQVIEYIVRAPLVVADLSFHNPNVFYELALRHAVRKPIVQLIREKDKLPFDVREFRTVKIDTTSIYTLVPRIETYRSEIASQIRMTLESTDHGENPLTVFYPGFWSKEYYGG